MTRKSTWKSTCNNSKLLWRVAKASHWASALAGGDLSSPPHWHILHLIYHPTASSSSTTPLAASAATFFADPSSRPPTPSSHRHISIPLLHNRTKQLSLRIHNISRKISIRFQRDADNLVSKQNFLTAFQNQIPEDPNINHRVFIFLPLSRTKIKRTVACKKTFKHNRKASPENLRKWFQNILPNFKESVGMFVKRER